MDFIKKQITDELSNHTSGDISLEVPPKQDMGDFAFPCFSLSKEIKKSPMEIAQELAQKVSVEGVTVKAIGPYLNFFIDKTILAKQVLGSIKADYGKGHKKEGLTLVESPGPNTNKPLHLGHLRNMLLGSAITNILRYVGKDVNIVNVVNDRGVHICKSMFAYQTLGNGDTPEKANRKSDHFVGDYYVKYSELAAKDPSVEEKVQDMLVKWENGDPEVLALWSKMNTWTLDGFKITYDRLKFSHEREYLESDTYKHGKDIIEQGLSDGLFSKNDDGAIVADLEDKKLGTKVLLRANGTSVYITQDIYMAKKRYEDFSFTEMIYVVGNEQEHHFKVLFEVFKKFGWGFADHCYHFSYGMVELPDGKMKSREGNVIDTDELIEEVVHLAKEEVGKRYTELSSEEVDYRAEVIGMAALRFFFLKYDPLKNFVFNPKESLAFEGETGPYVLYSYARICSIFRKVEDEIGKVNYSVLDTEEDRAILSLLGKYPTVLEECAKAHKPSTLCHYLLDLASAFTTYYHANPILKAEKEVRDARLALLDKVRQVIKSGMELLGIDVLEQM